MAMRPTTIAESTVSVSIARYCTTRVVAMRRNRMGTNPSRLSAATVTTSWRSSRRSRKNSLPISP